MAKTKQFAAWDEGTQSFRDPVSIGTDAENVELSNGQDLETVIGNYTGQVSAASKLSKIGADSDLSEATVETVTGVDDTDDSTVITSDTNVDITAGDTITDIADKYNQRGQRLENKFNTKINTSAIVTELASTNTNAQVPSALSVFTALQLPNLLPNSAASHRSIYRGINLVGTNAPFANIAALNAAVRAGNFRNIFVGDYFDITLPATSLSSAQTVRLVVMDINYYKNCGDTQFTANHLVLMPKDALANAASMNASNTTANGYNGSVMHTTTLPIYATAFKNAIGSSYILTHRDLLTNNVNTTPVSSGYTAYTGVTSGWAWYDVTLRLASESMVYGAPIWSSSGHDQGAANRQLAGFMLNPELLVKMLGHGSTSRTHWWLSSVVSSADFASVCSHGGAGINNASRAFGVVPLMVFG